MNIDDFLPISLPDANTIKITDVCRYRYRYSYISPPLVYALFKLMTFTLSHLTLLKIVRAVNS